MARFIKIRHRPFLRLPPAITLIVIALLVAGIGAGSLVVRVMESGEKQDLTGYLEGFLHGLSGHAATPSSAQIWQLSALQQLRMAGLLWFFGLTLIGLPLIAAVVFARGFFVGFTVGFFVQELGYRGVLLSLAGVLPHNLLGIPLLVFFAVYTANFSLGIYRYRSYRGSDLLRRIALYCLVCLVLTLALLVVSAIEAHISPQLLQWLSRWLIP